MNGLSRFPAALRRDPTIDVWFKKQTPELGALANLVRMRECGDDVRDVMHDGCPTACADDAAFGYVGVYRAHVNVGFFRGADLDDPGGLLEGTGKRMRHVKIRPGVVLDTAALAVLIGRAYADMKVRLVAEHERGPDASDGLRKDRRRHRTRVKLTKRRLRHGRGHRFALFPGVRRTCR